MKILFVSKDGDGLGIAEKLLSEGHDVRFYIKDSSYEFALLNIIERVTSWRPHAAKWADFVIADMVGFGKFATVLDKFEVPHLGFSLIADSMELDRQRQMQLLRRVGIRLPETHEFDSPNAAKDLMKPWRKPGWVLKPSGNIDTGKTILAYDPDTYEWALDQYTGDQELVVQRIVKGVEVSTEGWFNGKTWIEPFNHTFEEKRFLEGDLGPNTGCMGNVVIPASGSKYLLIKELKKLTPFLEAASFKGPVDLNTIVNEDGIFGLELTARFGYDAFEGLHELLTEPLGAMLLAVATGSKTEMRLRLKDQAVVVRLTVPPYPHADADKQDRGLPVIGLPKDYEHFYLTDVYKENGLTKWAGSDGVLMKVAGSGSNIKKARKKAYDLINRIEVNGLQFRRDIGERVEADMKQLKKWKVM